MEEGEVARVLSDVAGALGDATPEHVVVAQTAPELAFKYATQGTDHAQRVLHASAQGLARVQDKKAAAWVARELTTVLQQLR